MKKTLLFQSALPIGMAAVYFVVAIQFGADPALVAMFTVAITLGVAVIVVLFVGSAMFAIVIAASLAVIATTFTSANAFTALSIIALGVVFAILIAIVMQKELHPRSGVALLFLHNILWAGAIGLVAHFGVTPAGGEMLFAAVMFPLMLLWYETRKITSNWPIVP